MKRYKHTYEHHDKGMIAVVLVGIFAILVLFIAPSMVSEENMSRSYSKDWICKHDFNHSKCRLDIERK